MLKFQQMELKDKKVLITGASTGIGHSIALEFLKKGANLTVFGKNKPDFFCNFIKVDISKEDEIKSALKFVEKIDVLVNNAGVYKEAPITETSTDVLNELIDVNFKGLFWMTKHSIPKIANGGCIINIGSIAGIKNFQNLSIYSATKAAVKSLTETLALELSSRKIRVNCIAPGIVDTPLWEKSFGYESKKIISEMIDFVPLKLIGKPKEIADAVIFVCENNFITGSTIIIDGGEAIR